MFFKIFSDNQPIQAWDLRHLWIAQTLITSCISADGERYRSIFSENIFKDELTANCFDTAALALWRALYQHDDIHETVIKHLGEYLGHEIDGMVTYLDKAESFMPVPNPAGLVNGMRDVADFRDFIQNSNARMRKMKEIDKGS